MSGEETILAVSSPPGRSARGILRISGDGLQRSFAELFIAPPSPRSLTRSRLRMGATGGLPASASDFILPCLALYAPAPHTFTGQDTLEIQLPGNPALLERVAATAIDAIRAHEPDARRAEPGEFARRAFTSGRIDLTKAEGIAATIGAQSDAQLRAAKLLRTGKLGAWAQQTVDRLGSLLALVEAGIDFVDQEGVVAIEPAVLDDGLAALEREVQALLSRSRSWTSLEALPWVVICGRPNAGKSTLFNALLGRERAVTADVPGTTRDVLAEPLRIETGHGDAEVMLADVAGLDPTQTPLNESMQRAAQDAVAHAELILLLHDAADPLPPLPPPRDDVTVIAVQAKQDIHNEPSRYASGSGSGREDIFLSAITGQGVDDLRTSIAQAIGDRAITFAGEAMALTDRHRDELACALATLTEARQHSSPELASQSMRSALDHLGAIGGRLTPDDILGKVFSTFCIGK